MDLAKIYMDMEVEAKGQLLTVDFETRKKMYGLIALTAYDTLIPCIKTYINKYISK